MWVQRIYQNAQSTFWFMDLRRSINFARFESYFCLSPKCSFYKKVVFWAEPNAIFLQFFLICAFSAPKSANKRTLTSISCAFKTRSRHVLNFGSLNMIILKKKSKNTTKYHIIFTISSFLRSEWIFILFYLGQMLNS